MPELRVLEIIIQCQLRFARQRRLDSPGHELDLGAAQWKILLLLIGFTDFYTNSKQPHRLERIVAIAFANRKTLRQDRRALMVGETELVALERPPEDGLNGPKVPRSAFWLILSSKACAPVNSTILPFWFVAFRSFRSSRIGCDGVRPRGRPFGLPDCPLRNRVSFFVFILRLHQMGMRTSRVKF